MPMVFTLKYAFRQLTKSPGFTSVAVFILALGVAMSTSTFSLTNSVLLRSMPFAHSEQLVRIFRTTGEMESLPHSPGNYLDIKSAASSFSDVAAYYFTGGNIAEPGRSPEQAYGLKATASFFSILGIQPALGRGFSADQDQPGKGNVMLLAHAYWIKRFGGDPHVIGKTLRVGIDPLTIIGVLPESFDHTLIWSGVSYVCAETIWRNSAKNRDGKWFSILARLKPSATLTSAQAELSVIASRLARDYPADNAVDRLRVTDLSSSFVDGNTRKLYWLITGLAVSVLLIACANLASVQLARAFSRSHEFAVRAALGASRLNLMGPLLVESALISLTGGILGVVLAYWADHLISHLFAGDMEIPLDTNVIIFATVASVLTGVTFGLTPAWLATRVSTHDALEETSRGNTSSRLQQRFKFALIVGQLAFALVLVSGALSFGVAVRQSLHRDLGWQTTGLVSGIVSLPFQPYDKDEKKLAFERTLKARLEQLPGVAQVTIVTNSPLFGYSAQNNLIVEGTPPVPKGTEPLVATDGVDSQFFRILKIPLKAGRDFPEGVRASDPPLVIINETLAQQYWPGQTPLGKHLRFTDKEGWCEVIGVVGDVKMNEGFNRPISRLHVYRAAEHLTSDTLSFILKTSLPPDSFDRPVRKVVGDLDADVQVQQVAGVEQTLKAILSSNDLMMITLGSFAFVGLLIALIGLYGVIAQLTEQRRREIGVRISLGAGALRIVVMILSQSCRLLIGGVIIGLLGSGSVSHIFHQTMPELVLPGRGLQLGIALLFCAVGLAACYFPARRAGRIDPIEALRWR